MEIISGNLRPTRSATQPEATAPTYRIHKVSVKTRATSVSGTSNSLAIGTMISKNTVKSNASSVQPSQAAHHAIHWSLVGSFHHGTVFAPRSRDMVELASPDHGHDGRRTIDCAEETRPVSRHRTK